MANDHFSCDISRHIWDAKYRYRDAGKVRDATVEDTWLRVTRALAGVEACDRPQWEQRFFGALEDFKFLPGGRILAGAGTGHRVTLFNCFVMGRIEDSMDGIFEALKEGALTMQQGGGVGYDFSSLRPAGTPAMGVGVTASGPVSFMHIWDAMCATMLSTGARRGAMMATLRCDHPDIEAFVDAKRDPAVLRHFNLSVLVDHLLAEGLLSPYTTGKEDPPELTAMALARIRQLAAHEVGHTLGLEHNFLASVEGPQGRASVMDYPHPLTRLNPDGTIDLSDAYATGIGAWDDVAIAYGYQDFPAGTDEMAPLEKILADARARGLLFLTDQDARPFDSAHPQASLWDNGTDAVAELDRVMTVRRAALSRFGENAIRSRMPLATMEEALVPLYLHHRYQTVAAAKAIGGLYYTQHDSASCWRDLFCSLSSSSIDGKRYSHCLHPVCLDFDFPAFDAEKRTDPGCC